MFIKEIVIEGFKSYKKRTIISGFHSHYNAIRGRNGSGKSNILDAICFVLGISDLKRIRVNVLAQLIYKSGQANIKKANVTIIFDNSDKSNSHPKYLNKDSISIRREYSIQGQSKYSINGTRVSLENLKDFLFKCGLKVDKHNFLIMQNKIQETISKKEKEILEMVEDALGISDYTRSKRQFEREFEQKEKKLSEVDNKIINEITPELDNLSKYEKQNRILEDKRKQADEIRLDIACSEYFSKKANHEESEINFKRYAEKLELKQEKRNQLSLELKNLEAEEKALDPQTDESLDRKKNKIRSIEENINKYQSLNQGLLQEIRSMKADIENLEAESSFSLKQKKKLQKDLENSKNTLEALNTSVEQKEVELGTLKGGLQAHSAAAFKKKKHEQVITEVNSLRNKMHKIENKLSKKNRKLAESSNCQERIQKLDAEVYTLQNKLKEASNIDPSAARECQQKKTEYRKSQERINQELQSAKFQKFSFLGKQIPGLKGYLVELVKLKNKKHSKALEVGAGSALLALVVNNQQFGKQLIDRNPHKSLRVFPNDRMRPSSIDSRTIQEIQKRFENKARLALDLIDYNQEFYNSVSNVFGGFFVCENREIARKVTFMYKQKAITLEGDVYEPNGTMSGGSSSQSSNFELYNQLSNLKKEKYENDQAINKYESRLEELKTLENRRLNLEQDLQTKQKQLLQLKATQSNPEELSAQIIGLEAQKQKCQDELSEKLQEEQVLKKGLNSKKLDLPKEIKKLETELKRLENSKFETKKTIETVDLEIKKVDKRTQEIPQEFRHKTEELKASEEKQKQLEEEITNLNNYYDRKKNQVNEIEEKNLEVYQRKEQILKLKKENERDTQVNETRIKRLEKRISDTQKDIERVSNELYEILDKNPKVKQINFEANEFDEASKKEELKKLKEEIKLLESTYSSLDLSQVQKLQKEGSELKEKRLLLLEDLIEITEKISGLNCKKYKHLKSCFPKVVQKLSEIFGSLVRNAKVELIPEYGKPDKNNQNLEILKKIKLDLEKFMPKDRSHELPAIEDRINYAIKLEEDYLETETIIGLKFGIELNGIKKASLNELSGGQRSLFALAFIFSLQKQRPSPIYILDEVDAALDMSYTENIANMIKNDFPESQFLVVSLKEEMHMKANVLFDISYSEETSKVQVTNLNN